jgi:hypothetical protein
MAKSSEYGNRQLDSIEYEEFLDHLSNYQLFKDSFTELVK